MSDVPRFYVINSRFPYSYLTIANMAIIKWRHFLLPFWILFLALTAESLSNDADLDYTCDESGLHLKMNFDRPFRGLVYIKGYSEDPNCRLILPRSTSEASFNVPLMACDTFVRLRPETNPWIKGFLVFQQHPLVSTVDDFTEPFLCVVQKKTKAPWTEVLRKAYNTLNDSPKIDSWLDFELLPELVSEEQQSNFKFGSSYLFLYINGARKFSDMVVTDCIAHREPFLLRNASILQMTNPNGCSNTSTKTLSAFNIMRNDRGVIVGTYSEINPSQIPSLENGFVACSAVLCKRKCKCTKNRSPKGYGIIHSRKFPTSRFKRSIAESPNINQTRTFMKSTIKALAESLSKYRTQSKLLKNNTDFEKRASFSVKGKNVDDTTLGLYPTEQFVTEFTTEFSEDFEVHNLNTNLFSVNISTTIIPEKEVENILANLVEHTTTIKSTSKTNATSNDPFPGNYSITLIPEIVSEKKFNLIEQSTIETSSNYDTTTKVSEESTQNPEDIISTTIGTPGTEEPTGNVTAKAEESYLDQSCTTQLKFVVVIAVLSFVIFCLILISCGLALYLKKERKKHIIDSYLLYNFY
ncbi:hypothetical protein JTE90_025182 [Oedothorax gibbosus]|uniref:ZP domain-containing protein n=1 Tax=Oedothorax gibbosus TaxID=931172 RepID=A0AAV6UBX3_9ARAC|nr:hypothetical protein JTE90_025182 [Oedothorax gibbosus]